MKLSSSKPLKILVLEDDIIDRKLLERLLAKSSLPIEHVDTSGTLKQALDLLEKNEYDVILSDLNLPDSKNLNTVTKLDEKAPDIVKIVSTGLDDEEIGIQAIKQGADDYLVKGKIVEDVLERSICYTIERREARKRSEESLREALGRFEAVIENAPMVAIQGFDRQGQISHWNATSETLYGYSAAEVVGRRLQDIILTEDSLGPFEKALEEIYKTHQPTKPEELLITTKDNQKRWVISSMFPVFEHGDVAEVYCMDIDITERKQMHEILDRKQRNLETIFDAAPVGMMLLNKDGLVKRVNEVVRQMVQKEYSQIVYQRFGSVIGCVYSTEKGCEQSKHCSQCPLTRAVNDVFRLGRPVKNIEYHPKLQINGRIVKPWFRISVEPTTVDDKMHVVVAFDDITERKKAEQELSVAENKYRTIFENSAVAITLVDEKERLISWNKFMEDMLGMTKEDLYLRPIKTLYPEEEWERIRKSNIRRKGMQHHLETKMLKKNGEIIDVDISLSVQKDSEAEITGSIGVITDITERKIAERKLMETMEIKSQFISTVSHELRTPLTSIKESISIVLNGEAGRVKKGQKNFLEIAKRNIDRLSRLINDVLDFQKLGAGRMEFHMSPNDVSEVIRDACNAMGPFAKKENVNLQINLQDNIPQGVFDSDRMIQVLTNLISNAIKFTPENGQVTVNAKFENDEMQISVADTGMGIPKDDLPKIFDQFYRVHRPGKEIQGTGLGLPIVNKIVTAHGGRIDIESEVNRGTTFTIYLPIEAKPVPPQEQSEDKDQLIEETVKV